MKSKKNENYLQDKRPNLQKRKKKQETEVSKFCMKDDQR